MSFEDMLRIAIDNLNANHCDPHIFEGTISSFNLDFLRKNAEDCKKQSVNYIDFLDKLVRCVELTRNEKIWNLFKNISEECKETDAKFIQEHLTQKGYRLNDEILSYFNSTTQIDFKAFLQLFDKYSLQLSCQI